MFLRFAPKSIRLVFAFAAALLVSGCAAFHPPEKDHDKPFEAASFRHFQRLSADGSIPENALLRAKEQRDALLASETAGAGITADSWTWIGPGNIGGRIRAILIHPTLPNTLWIGSASGGIWKTTDGGASWTPLDDFLPTLSIGCMMLKADDPDTLYAGTGEGFFETVEGSSNTSAVRGAGIFRSTDAGESWTQIPSTAIPEFHFVNRLATHPSNPDLILAATNSGIWRSVDAGESWSRTSTALAYDVKIDPNNPVKAVASGHDNPSGPLYSIDGGLTWQQGAGIPDSVRIELAYAPATASLVYGMSSGSGSSIRCYQSTNGGQTWTAKGTTPNSTYSTYNNTIWVSPTDSNLLVTGGVYLSRSTNGGTSFSSAFSSVHPDMHAIVNDPAYDGVNNRRIYIGTDGGIYRADNASVNTAIDLNNGLGITQFYGAAVVDATGVILGGTQDNGNLRNGSGTESWFDMSGGDGAYVAYDPTNTNIWYAGYYFAQMFRSNDNANNISAYITESLPDAGSKRSNFITYFLLDPNSPTTMLVGCRSLWKSTNVRTSSNPSWISIKPAIGREGGDGGYNHFEENSPFNISTITIDHADSNRIFVGYNNGQIWYTSNGTNPAPTWSRIDNLGSTLPARWVSNLAIDPQDPARIYASFMGYEPDNLWTSISPYDTWSRVTGSGEYALPAAPISALALHPDIDGWVYVGTDVGIFTSTDNGTTWSTTTNGPGTVPVEQLIWRNSDTLMAVTHGRGIFFADIDRGLNLGDPVPGLAGQANTLTADNCTSGRRVYFIAGARAGLTQVPGCDITVDIRQPEILGSSVANGDGFTSISANVPAAYSGRTFLLQAVERDTCRVSNLVQYRFP